MKDRWFIPTEKAGWDIDGSMLPAEWHDWLHHTTDLPPTVKPKVHYKWMVDHKQNLSGSTLAYTPYST